MTPPLPTRFEDPALLGQGGMGAVWRVFDRERGEAVALKTLTGPNAEARFLFKQEFWAMRALRHPNLPEAHDYGESDDGTPWFTMALVPGEELGASLPRPEAEVRALLPGLLQALAHLHAHGWLHGDLKPENIRVGEGGHATLMDLGLLTRAGKPAGAIRGTLAYLAPEAVRQGALDARTDLYALGAVLFEVLSGAPPFRNHDTLGLLRAHLETPPPSLQGVAPDLAAAVWKLLAKDPADRFAGAAALADALGLQAALDEGQALLAAPLVGRDALFADLRGFVTGPVADTDLPARTLVGAPGAGRTRLLDALRAEAQLAGMPVLFARGEGEDAPPYQALRPWLRALVADARHPAVAAAAPVLVRLLPELGAVEPAPALDGAQERVRLQATIAGLARRRFKGARAWLVDDADRLDPASRELVAALRRDPDPAWRWVFAGEAAADDAPASPLAPLGPDEVLTLAGHVLGLAPEAVPAPLAEALAAAGGLPGAIAAALDHWVATGELRRVRGSWAVADGTSLVLPATASGALDARLAALGDDARAVARAAAVVGAVGTLPMLALVAALPDEALFAALTALADAGMLAVDGGAYRFGRPAEAAAIAGGLAAVDGEPLHARAAAWLEASLAPAADPHHAPTALAPAPLETLLALARHRLGAGDLDPSTYRWTLEAVDRALALHAVAQAEPLITSALAREGTPDAERTALLARLAYVRRHQARLDEARAIYDDELLGRLRRAKDPTLAAHLVSWGILRQLLGKYDDAREAYAEAVALADAACDPVQGARARVFLGRVAYFTGATDTALGHLTEAVTRARAGDDPAARVWLAWALGLRGYLLATTGGDEPAGLAALEEAIALNDALGNLVTLQEALSNLGNVHLAVGRFTEAAAVFERCAVLCERIGSANEAIFAHVNLGAARLELGDLAVARADADRARAMAHAQGRKFPESYATVLLGASLAYQGDVEAGLAAIGRGLALAREIGNRYVELAALAARGEAEFWAGRWEAATDTAAEARAVAAETGNGEVDAKLDRLEALLAEAGARVAPGEEKSLDALVRAARTADRPGKLAPLLRWAAWAASRRDDPAAAIGLALEAAAVADQAGMRRTAAEARLELGRARLAAGDPHAATEAFDAALTGADACGDRPLGLLARAGLAAATDDPVARREAARALEALVAGLPPDERRAFFRFSERAEAVAVPVETGDGVPLARLRRLTDLIGRLATAADLEDVLRAALAALVELADAERGFVLLYDGFAVTTQLYHGLEPGEPYSTGLAEQVLWGGEPVWIDDLAGDAGLASRESVQALSLRSAVGLPLKLGDVVTGVMLADSRRVGAGWSAADMALAEALAQAAASGVDQARRREALADEVDALGLLADLAFRTAGTPPEAALAEVLATAAALTGAERGWVLAGDTPEGLAPLAALGGEPAISRTLAAWVLERREPLHIIDVSEAEGLSQKLSVMALGLRTVWAVPLEAGETCLGVLYLDAGRVSDPGRGVMAALARLGALAGAIVARRGLTQP